jgi:ABC-type multidrug transport system fused ATPase/permease subunit
MSTDSIFWLLQNLWRHISSRRQIQFVLLLVLIIFASLAEMLSIGAVLPFLGVLNAPDRVFDHPSAQPFIQFLGITSATQLLLPLTLAFAAAALLTGGARLVLLWASMRVSYAAGADLSYRIYQRTLYQTYSVHVARNSSEVIAGISVKVEAVTHNSLQVLNLISAIVILVSILLVLLVIDPIVATTAMGGFLCTYLLIIRITRSLVKANSHGIARNSSQVIKALQEGLGGIRDVLIDGSQATYCQIYRHADLPLRKAQGSNSFISSSPRTGIEALSMMLFAGLAYTLSRDAGGFGNAIPILGALAMGAQRMLPSMQQAYASWTSLRGAHVSLKDAVDLLNQPLPDYVHQEPPTPIPFEQHIALRQVGFRYTRQSPWVFRNVNLNIPKGSRIGFIGTTGSGKSTLLDIVMSLLPATEGTFEVDGKPITPANQRAWQAHIAHVPQAIFLTDSSVAENIAFGIPKNQIDLARVRLVARQAQISEDIESWPQQYGTFVGERGIRLSGGQRQRIGIARALYKQANVIIFDEATSALDNDTEQSVMQAIESLNEDLTVLIIAHRLTTLKNCTQIVELGDQGVARIGTYRDIVAPAI